ncbi:MAG: chromosomal replication initiator protein DnaA [Oscillospiraceae bacterium]|nr:chromosomal replication initiator protein DnaA [Oscillospiraceae bacterium]
MDSFGELWGLVTAELESELSEVIYNVWIKELVPVSFDDGVVTLAIGEFKRKIVEQKFSEVLHGAFERTLGFPVSIDLVEPEGSESAREALKDKKLQSDDNTFDTFVIGSSNKFAHAAALAVAANPGGAYNPLFIYGRSGLGKTHLLCAVANEIRQNNPGANIILTHGEEFTNELVYCIAQKTMKQFQNKYRSADVLLMDDVQFIAGRERTQEEFFHTFNTLTQDGRQVVLTSDKPPKDILTLEERLRTRFEWGLIADIQPPDIETRMAIIQQKADLLELELRDDVVHFIADKLKNNIRQLEGAVKKIKAMESLHGATPNMTTAQTAIKDILSEEKPPVTIDEVITEVARTYGADPADIRSKKRDAQTSRMRQISMYVVSEITGMSTKAIGLDFGGRDHSTVVYALQEMKRLLAKDSSLRATVSDIIKNVQKSD